MKHNVKRVIMIEGKLGQGTAAGQTEGFLQAYKKAGKDIGNLLDSVGVKGAGGKDLQVVFWGSGGWFADPAKKVMQDAITSLGADGFDGAYVQNDEMMTGALQAMQEAGLDPSKYWLGSSNGKEKSWKWVAKGIVTMDVNECPTLEADIAYQQIKADFAGKPYKKAVFVTFMPYDKSNLDKKTLIPWIIDGLHEEAGRQGLQVRHQRPGPSAPTPTTSRRTIPRAARSRRDLAAAGAQLSRSTAMIRYRHQHLPLGLAVQDQAPRPSSTRPRRWGSTWWRSPSRASRTSTTPRRPRRTSAPG